MNTEKSNFKKLFTPWVDVKWIASRTFWLIAGMFVAGWLV